MAQDGAGTAFVLVPYPSVLGSLFEMEFQRTNPAQLYEHQTHWQPLPPSIYFGLGTSHARPFSEIPVLLSLVHILRAGSK